MKTASVTVTFCQLTSHLASEAVNRPDISHQQLSGHSTGQPLIQAPVYVMSLIVSRLTVLVVTPHADQVLHLASGVCPVGSIKLSHYIKHSEAELCLL